MWAIHLEEAIALFPGTCSLISSFLHASICSSVQQTLPHPSRAPGIGCPREQGLALTLGTWPTGGAGRRQRTVAAGFQSSWKGEVGAGERAGGPLVKGPEGDVGGVAARGLGLQATRRGQACERLA